MDKIKSKPGLLHFFADCPVEVREYFQHIPKLLDLELSVVLAYVFARVELAHNMALYCGVIKLHQANAEIAYRAVQTYRITRADFRSKYETVYGKPISKATWQLLTQAEGVRDRVMHGKDTNDDQMRNAVAHVLAYAKEMNKGVADCGGPKPFGKLQGFKGARQSLEKETTRWMLMGMGFFSSETKVNPAKDSE